MSGCHPSALTHSCTNVFGLTHQWVSFQCLTLESRLLTSKLA
ncbi:hypothetical protein [Wolbachia endosymbiont (group A) of Apoderus coryli]|nr:hypothetical protein [Wolbachia endosymbiont (group A) of Apoderus coryli]